ncbi:MAG: hypothetical protein R3357_10640 [Burkholderiales bacterium]|nr:hypothetical protein [Burkholderiales bacterium]
MIRVLARLVLVSALASPAVLHAQSLGRLFLTPEQRAALDLRRASRVPDKPAAVVVESPTARIDGQVVRSDGRSTVWVNGQAVREGAQAEGLRVAPASRTAESVSLAVGEDARRVELKVGETMNRDTGEVRGMLGDGQAGVSSRLRAPGRAGAPR